MYDQLKIEYDKASHGIDLTVYHGQTISPIESQNYLRQYWSINIVK